MSTLTQPFTFTPGTYAVASQVNADFSVVFGWINGGSAIWADATRAFTAIPVGPAVDPTTANQLARKAYVDSSTAAYVSAHAVQFDGNSTINRIQGGSVVVAADAGGSFSYVYPNAFPTQTVCVVAMVGQTNNHTTWNVQRTFGTSRTGFSGRIGSTNVDGNPAAGNYTIEYIAIGF